MTPIFYIKDGNLSFADKIVLDNLELYIREADKHAKDRMRNNNGVDPVRNFWMFDSDTQFDAVESN